MIGHFVLLPRAVPGTRLLAWTGVMMTKLAACSHCGSPVVVGDAVCGSCGTRLVWIPSVGEAALEVRPQPQVDDLRVKVSRRLVWVLVVLVLAAAAAVVTFVLVRRDGEAGAPVLPIEGPGGVVLSQACRNEAYGITVYYPGDWAVYGEPDSPEEACQYYRQGDFSGLSLIEVWASPLQVAVADDLGEWVDVVEFYRRGGFGTVTMQEQEIVVGGHSGSLFDLEMDLGDGTVLLLHVYVVPLVGGDAGSPPLIIKAQGEAGTSEYREALVVADAVAATMRFGDT
jgi:hypothetical protein